MRPSYFAPCTASQVRSAARAIFSFNRATTDPKHVQSQIDLGFDALRDLSALLPDLERERRRLQAAVMPGCRGMPGCEDAGGNGAGRGRGRGR